MADEEAGPVSSQIHRAGALAFERLRAHPQTGIWGAMACHRVVPKPESSGLVVSPVVHGFDVGGLALKPLHA